MIIDLISRQRLPDYGYEIRTEWWKLTKLEDDSPTRITSAYSLKGDYIGNVRVGYYHRAMFGSGIGDIVKKDDYIALSGYTDEYLMDHPEDDFSLPIGFEAKNMDDAKRMAIAFADSVS